MNRGAFLKRLTLGVGGLIVGEQVLEELARLGHVRKSFPSAAVYPRGLVDMTTTTSVHGLRDSTYQHWATDYQIAEQLMRQKSIAIDSVARHMGRVMYGSSRPLSLT